MDALEIIAIPLCPHCGQRDYVYRNVRAFGWIQDYFGFDGKVFETDLDNLRASNSKTLRCCYCHRVRQDVVLIDGVVIPKLEGDNGRT